MEKHIENSKLITLLRSFKEKELEQFAEFLTLPLLKPKPDDATFKLLECVIEAFPDFSSPKLSHTYLQQYCFKGADNKYSALANRMSRLMGHAENFLVFKKLELEHGGKGSKKAPAIKEHYLLDTLLEREATDYFPHSYNAANKALAERPADGETYLTRYLLEHDNLRYQHSYAPRLTKADLQPLIDAGDRYFILSKLIMSNEVASVEAMRSGETHQHRFTKEILKTNPENLYEDHAFILAYRWALMMCLEPRNEESFENFMRVLSEDGHQIEKKALRDLFVIASNYCIHCIKHGIGAGYQETLLDIYDEMERQKVLRDKNGTLPYSELKNMVTIALQLRETSRARTILKERAKMVHANARDYVVGFCECAIDMYADKHERVINAYYLRGSSEDPYFETDWKALALRSAFELSDERFDDIAGTFKKYIKETPKISAVNKPLYNAFVLTTIQLFRAKTGVKTQLRATDLEKAQRTIEGGKVVLKKWLGKKLAELRH